MRLLARRDLSAKSKYVISIKATTTTNIVAVSFLNYSNLLKIYITYFPNVHE